MHEHGVGRGLTDDEQQRLTPVEVRIDQLWDLLRRRRARRRAGDDPEHEQLRTRAPSSTTSSSCQPVRASSPSAAARFGVDYLHDVWVIHAVSAVAHMSARSGLCDGDGRLLPQGLQHDAVTLRRGDQLPELFSGGIRFEIEDQSDVREPDGRLGRRRACPGSRVHPRPGWPRRPRYLGSSPPTATSRPHMRRAPAGACRRKQARTVTACRRMQAGFHQCSAGRHRAGDVRVRKRRCGAKRDRRGPGLGPIALLQRRLGAAQFAVSMSKLHRPS